MFKGFILSVLVVVFGLIAIASLVVFILKSKNEKSRTVWLGIFIVSLSISLTGIVYTVKKLIDKTIDKSYEIRNDAIDVLGELLTDERKYLLDSTTKNTQIELLKSYVPDSISKKVPNTFYTHFGFRDSYRFPLVYPYTINCVDAIELGQIFDERNAIDITYNDDGVNQLQIYDITDFTFDSKMLLVKLAPQTDDKEIMYILFHFDTQETEQMDTYSTLIKKAKSYGFSGSDSLITIKEYDSLF